MVPEPEMFVLPSDIGARENNGRGPGTIQKWGPRVCTIVYTNHSNEHNYPLKIRVEIAGSKSPGQKRRGKSAAPWNRDLNLCIFEFNAHAVVKYSCKV